MPITDVHLGMGARSQRSFGPPPHSSAQSADERWLTAGFSVIVITIIDTSCSRPERGVAVNQREKREQRGQRMITGLQPPQCQMLLHLQDRLQRQAHAPEDRSISANAPR